MKIRFFGIAFALLIVSCTQKVEPFSCEEMEQMMESDQDLRKNSKLLTGNFHYLLDSISNARGEKSQGKEGKKYYSKEVVKDATALSNEFMDKHKEQYDSIWQVQGKIDLRNTNRILETIETNDFEFLLSNDCFKNFSTILVHSPYEKSEHVRQVIEKRKDLISENKYRHITWHLDGRPPKINDNTLTDILINQ